MRASARRQKAIIRARGRRADDFRAMTRREPTSAAAPSLKPTSPLPGKALPRRSFTTPNNVNFCAVPIDAPFTAISARCDGQSAKDRYARFRYGFDFTDVAL